MGGRYVWRGSRGAWTVRLRNYVTQAIKPGVLTSALPSPPLSGYLASMSFILCCLAGKIPCKLLIRGGLRTKYLFC